MHRRTTISRRRVGPDDRGYVLLVFALFSALLVIGMYRILPKYVFEGQRIKEEELIFRGEQYKRAIQLYVRKFGRYPTSLEELEDTNQIRFIRKLYKDPMTPEGEWRLVHIGPNATFYDSIHMTGGSSSSETGEGDSDRERSDPFDLSPRDPDLQADQDDPATRASNNPNTTQQPRASAGVQVAQQQTFGGGGIAGVASKNEGEGIKLVGGLKQYNEWEFLYDYRTDPIALAAVNRVSGVGQQQIQGPPAGGGGSPPGGQPTGRNPFGQPIGTSTPGIGGPSGIPGSRVPIPGGGVPAPGGPPTWRGGQPPSRDPFGRP